jgi:hypothetical protein
MAEASDIPLGPTRPSSTQKRPQAEEADTRHLAWVELTSAEPSNQEAWMGRAETAKTLEEKITSLTRALELNPGNGMARQGLHASLQHLLRSDASLGYLGETGSFYRLRTPSGFEFIHPKDRVASEPHSPSTHAGAQAVYRWLKWSLFGLIPVGLGTLVFAPVTIIQAITALQQPLDQSDRRRVWIAILLSTLLGLAAVALLMLLILHLT